MPGITHMTLDIPGATPGEIQRGLDAAQRALDAAGVDAYFAANSHWLREMQNCFPVSVDLPADHNACEAWIEACDMAVEACCTGWTGVRPFPLAALNLSDDYRAEMRLVHSELAAAILTIDRELLPDEPERRRAGPS
jgi:hypothetical protein